MKLIQVVNKIIKFLNEIDPICNLINPFGNEIDPISNLFDPIGKIEALLSFISIHINSFRFITPLILKTNE